MSSIAYVTEVKMIEYNRLCGNRRINFWRLTSHKEFTNFHPGELLFFYTRPNNSRKKGFVGYAHYVSSQSMSLEAMWKKYGNSNGYDTLAQMEEAIRKAAKDKPIPERMSCLQLEDVVFFLGPVYPEEVGLRISPKLESYYYLDQEDPATTVKILKVAEDVGIDIWSAPQISEPESIFRRDEIRHQLTLINKQIGKTAYTEKESAAANKLAKEYLKNNPGELIRGSRTDIIEIEDDQVKITVPFVSQSRNYALRKREFFGKLTLYKLQMKQRNLPVKHMEFQVLCNEDEEEIQKLTEYFNHE